MDFILRTLKEKDADFMLEWMHDEEISRNFVFDAKSTTKEKALDFISKSQKDNKNLHFAIADKNDEYLGTISLKNIDLKNKNAEYAIGMRKKAIGTGAAAFATKQIANYAFEKLNIEKVYLNVLSDNLRAVCFYEKMGFVYEGELIKHVIKDGEHKNLKLFALFNDREGTK